MFQNLYSRLLHPVLFLVTAIECQTRIKIKRTEQFERRYENVVNRKFKVLSYSRRSINIRKNPFSGTLILDCQPFLFSNKPEVFNCEPFSGNSPGFFYSTLN